MPIVWLRIAAINGFLAVAAGAFATHALRDELTPEVLATLETGVRYHMYHTLALLVVALASRHSRAFAVPVAGWCFTVGIVLFSGSLYALALTGQMWLRTITPFGGAAFLVGWAALVTVPLRRRSRFHL
jgi:uncharacterized membrane protein YgdD (TMEM256/DUF423 family)